MAYETNYSFSKYICLFVNILFLLCLSPFYITSKTRNSSIIQPEQAEERQIRTFLPQMVICILLHPICIINAPLLSRMVYVFTDIKKNPDSLYVIVRLMWQSTFVVVLLYGLWFKQNDIKRLVNNVRVLKPTSKLWDCILTIILLLHVGVIISVAIMALGRRQRMDETEKWLSTFMFVARSAYFIPNKPPFAFSFATILEKVLTTFIIIYQIFAVLAVGFVHVFLVQSSICLYRVVDTHQTAIEKLTDVKGKVSLFNGMVTQIKLINNFVGSLVLVIVVEMVIYGSSVLGKPEICEGWQCTFYTFMFVFCIAGFILACEANFKAVRTRQAIFRFHDINCEVDNVSGHDVAAMSVSEIANAMSQDGRSKQLGLSGWKFLTITYNFFGATVATSLTYSLVLLQFSSSATKYRDG